MSDLSPTEEEREEGAEDASPELPPQVPKLEDGMAVLRLELKDSEQKRMELIHNNLALQNKLKASQEAQVNLHQEVAVLEERLLPVLQSQVRAG